MTATADNLFKPRVSVAPVRAAHSYFSIVCGAFLLFGWLIAHANAAPVWLPMGLFVGAYVFGGWYTTREAIENLRARRFEIDTLMLVAAAGAATAHHLSRTTVNAESIRFLLQVISTETLQAPQETKQRLKTIARKVEHALQVTRQRSADHELCKH